MQQPTTADAPVGFLSLPSELRNEIYDLVILHQELIYPWVGWNPKPNLTLGLLRANKVVHGEASSVLYGKNHFDFTRATPHEVASFLQRIGSINASYIRYISIDFPAFRHLDSGDVALEQDGVSILGDIQSSCTTLSTITTSLQSSTAMEFWLDDLDNHKIADEALKLVDARFRAISSLQDIILEVCEGGPSDHIRRRMKSHGWTINTTEYVEEEDCDRDLSDFDYHDDYGYGDDSDGEDNGREYDFDDDSDFWRRAAD